MSFKVLCTEIQYISGMFVTGIKLAVRSQCKSTTVSWPSHTTIETAKKVVIVHTHYNFFSQLQRFFQQFCIRTKIFTTIFSEKS